MVKAARVGVAAWDGAAGHAAEVEARVARVPASPQARAAAGKATAAAEYSSADEARCASTL